ncbi:hypothetical protein Dimus_009503 [Dionaea muscipula]
MVKLSSAASFKPRKSKHHRTKFIKLGPIHNDDYSSDHDTASTSGSESYRSLDYKHEQALQDDQDEGDDPHYSYPDEWSSATVGKTSTGKGKAKSYSDSDSESKNTTDETSNNSLLSRLYGSYVSIAPLPVFHGNDPAECPIKHLSQFNKSCRANNGSSVEMMVRIFPVTLAGEAALWGELMSINQGLKEVVRSYFLRLQWMLERWRSSSWHGNISEEAVKDIFVDGLRQELKEWIVPQNPSSLSDALRLAFAWERVLKDDGFATVGDQNQINNRTMDLQDDANCGFCAGPHDETQCLIRDRMRDLWFQNSHREPEELEAKRFHFEVPVAAARTTGGGVVVATQGGMVAARAASTLKKQKSMCQCSKHQCWKKLDNSN